MRRYCMQPEDAAAVIVKVMNTYGFGLADFSVEAKNGRIIIEGDVICPCGNVEKMKVSRPNTDTLKYLRDSFTSNAKSHLEKDIKSGSIQTE